MPYPPIVLDRAANLPLYRQIEVALRRSILDGRIGPGHGCPGSGPTRGTSASAR